MRNEQRRDIIVVGASAGGVEALCALNASLTIDIPASIFVVLHVSATFISILPEILTRKGSLTAQHPSDKTLIEPGRIYVALPDHQFILEPGCIRVTSDPKENGYRPCIDTLFRSAAEVYGARTVGVVLSGTLEDGSAGLTAIHNHGGYSIAQDPSQAKYPGMPQNAIEHNHVDEVLRVEQIAARLAALARR